MTLEAGSATVAAELERWDESRRPRRCAHGPRVPSGMRLARRLVVDAFPPEVPAHQQFELFVVDDVVGAAVRERWHRDLQQCPFTQKEVDSDEARRLGLNTWAADFSIRALMQDEPTKVRL